MDARDILAILFGAIAVIGVLGGAFNRYQLQRSIGAQFIRYNAIVIALPIAASLALQNMLPEAAVSIVLGSLGYAFAGSNKGEK